MTRTELLGRAVVGRARGVSRRLSSGLKKGPIILTYHRVGAALPDPQLLTVARDCFEEQMTVIAEVAQPFALRQLASRVGVPSNGVAITFDDGYADNLHAAKPILERRGLPATVFATTSYIGSMRQPWWDELAGVLLGPGTLPEQLTLRVGVQLVTIELDGDACYRDDRAWAHSRWNIQAREDPSRRHAAYRVLFRMMRTVTAEERDVTLARLGALAQPSHKSPRFATMSEEELRELIRDGLIELGAHTVSHPVLARLSQAAQMNEVRCSRTHLEETFGVPVESFSYPFGGWRDYDAGSVCAVVDAGFKRACVNTPGCVRGRTDLFQLPRMIVRNWSGCEFERRLRMWLG